MGSRVLYIGPEEKKSIKAVMDYAENHFFDQTAIEEILSKKRLCAGDDPNHVCFLTGGFRVVYSIEIQNGVKCRHMSVSIDNIKAMPSPESVQLIAQQFGFRGILQDWVLWVEKDVSILNVGNVSAINILQRKDES